MRLSKGLSRAKLGSRIFVSSQQIQKYELGINIISAARLVLLSTELQVPITYFYDNFLDEELITENQTMNLWLSRNFRKINSFKTKNAINKLITSLAEDEEENKKGGENA